VATGEGEKSLKGSVNRGRAWVRQSQDQVFIWIWGCVLVAYLAALFSAFVSLKPCVDLGKKENWLSGVWYHTGMIGVYQSVITKLLHFLVCSLRPLPAYLVKFLAVLLPWKRRAAMIPYVF